MFITPTKINNKHKGVSNNVKNNDKPEIMAYSTETY